MSNRLSALVVASCLALPGFALADEGAELTPEKVAAIRRDEKQALSKVDAEFGNRKSSEMSTEERGQSIDKQSAATTAVLEKHGVSAKDYARYTARMTPEDNERAKAEEKRLESQASQAAQKPAAEAEGEIPIQQGFSNEDPVELEAAEGAEPVVDVGVPGAQEEAGNIPVEAMDAPPQKPAKRATSRSSGSSGVVRKKAVKR